MMRFETRSAEESIRLGQKIGQCLKPADNVLLFGDLGAGKTTFTLGLARGLGLPDSEYVRSPTFTLINEYQGRHPIYHLDLYRIESDGELDQLGLEEIFSATGVCIVEWAEKMVQPNDSGKLRSPLIDGASWLEIRIDSQADDTRSYAITPHNFAPKSHPIFSLQ